MVKGKSPKNTKGNVQNFNWTLPCLEFIFPEINSEKIILYF